MTSKRVDRDYEQAVTIVAEYTPELQIPFGFVCRKRENKGRFQ